MARKAPKIPAGIVPPPARGPRMPRNSAGSMQDRRTKRARDRGAARRRALADQA